VEEENCEKWFYSEQEELERLKQDQKGLNRINNEEKQNY
jgi:hypothetical protein